MLYVGQRCFVAVWQQDTDQLICSSVNALALLLPRRLKSKEKENRIRHDCREHCSGLLPWDAPVMMTEKGKLFLFSCREHRRVARWTEATSAACFQSYGWTWAAHQGYTSPAVR